MQLIVILLYVVAALTILTGLSVFFGTNRQSRLNTTWFFVATLGTAIWAASIANFLSLPSGADDFAAFLVVGIIIGITVNDIALLGYLGWNTKIGKVLTALFFVLGAVLVSILIYDHTVFYTAFELGGEWNRMFTVQGWYFVALIVYYTLMAFCYTSFLSASIKKTKNKMVKLGQRVFYVGLVISGLSALFFDLILLEKAPHLIWIGPMAISAALLTLYYSVVRCRTVVMSANWMKILSFIILASSGAVIYILIFYVIFVALFRIPNPSPQVLFLNIIMATIVLCLLPTVSEIYNFMKSFIATKDIDVGYITKKMNRLTKRTLDLKELAGFLADHLHFEYIGFLINGRLYGSGNLEISNEELALISKLKIPERGIRQDIKPISKICSDSNIRDIALLYNTKNEVFGQIIVGPQTFKRNLDAKDIIEIEMIINLAAAIINGNKH